MAEKKVTGVKSVTLGDVKAVDAQTGIKSSSSTGVLPPNPDLDDIDLEAKELDQDIKDFDRKEKTTSSKDLDKRGKQADTKAKKANR